MFVSRYRRLLPVDNPFVMEDVFVMPKTLDEVTRDAAGLPAPERLKLARILLDLSEADTFPTNEVQTAWDDEIERRLRELRTGAVKGVPLTEVKKRIEAGFSS